MTDKEKVIKELKETLDSLDITNKYRLNLIRAIEYLQEEPVSSVWYDARKTIPEDSAKQIICIKEDGLAVATIGKIVTGTIKWAYLDTLLHISNKNLTESQCRELIDTAFELGKAANKDKPVSEDLEEYINELSKQFPEVSFAKLSRIAVRVAKWQKEHLWKPADDDLPEINREVIALTQPYPNDEHLRVVFAHRPSKYTKVWNSDLGEEQVVEIEGYDKGGWNIPDVKYWLDVELPKEIEL